MLIHCKHCDTRLLAVHGHPNKEQVKEAIETYSRRCWCNMCSDTLRGLLKGEPEAISQWQTHYCRWLQTDGPYTPESAFELAHRAFHLSERQRAQIHRILLMRETPQPSTPEVLAHA